MYNVLHCTIEMDVQEERSNDLDHPLLKAPVSLFSADPKAYTATLLRLILPTIMNPFGGLLFEDLSMSLTD